jgi:hypothetical protein
MSNQSAFGALFISVLIILLTATVNLGSAQSPEKMRLGYSGTGINNYVWKWGAVEAYFARTASTWKWCM